MKKGYFSTVTENHFNTLEDGTRVFYAQGPVGRRGFVVPNPEVEAELKQATRTYYICLIVMCGVFGGMGAQLSSVTVSTALMAIGTWVVVAYAITNIYFHQYTKQLAPVADSPNSPLAHWRRIGSESKGWIIWGGTILSALFTISSWWLYFHSGEPLLLVSAMALLHTAKA